jgi:hypothetical protein
MLFLDRLCGKAIRQRKGIWGCLRRLAFWQRSEGKKTVGMKFKMGGIIACGGGVFAVEDQLLAREPHTKHTAKETGEASVLNRRYLRMAISVKCDQFKFYSFHLFHLIGMEFGEKLHFEELVHG